MSHIDPAVKVARNEAPVSKHVPITHFNSPTVLETQSGSIFSVIRFSGAPFETEKTDTINRYHQIWHKALMTLDERFSVIGTIHRRKANCHLGGQFTNAFAQKVNDAYQAQFQDQSMYVNDLYLAVVLKGLTTGKVGWLTSFIKNIIKKYVKEARNHKRESDIKLLNDVMFQLETTLSEFGPSILGEQDKEKGSSELLSYLSLFVNGGESLHYKRSQYYSSIDKSFFKSKQTESKYPYGNVSQYISAKRIFIGDYIQFQGQIKTDVKYGAIISVKKYGTESASIMLDPLLHLDSDFISTNSFFVETKPEADKRISRHAVKMENANDPAVSQKEALNTARDMLASDSMMMGYHHNTVMLLGNTIDELEQVIASAIKCYMDAGYVAVRESLGLEATFWAQIPGNDKYIARSSLISSKNYVDFFPLHNYRTGFYNSNHLGSAMTLIETPSKTPLWMNLHAKGPKDNPSPGHTTIIGGNGSGKTVAMCFFDSQLNRYSGKSFFFDRDRGAEVYVRACGGDYSVLSPDHANDISFNPFSLPDNRSNRKFCKELLIQMLKNDGENSIESDVVNQISECVSYCFDKLAPEHRNLTNAVSYLPMNFKRNDRLKQWLRENGSTPEGEFAYLFDNDHDSLHLQHKMGFDMTHFLDKEDPNVLAAVSMYLFHRIEMSLAEDGKLTSIFLDEGWQYLRNAYWEKRILEWLPTFRKYNCHIVFSTQSPKTVVQSNIGHIILDNCATNIYFSNPQAKESIYIEGFNLTETEFNCVHDNEPQSRIFLYKQGHQSTLGRLNLSHLGDYLLIMSGTPDRARMLEGIRDKHGNNPDAWVPVYLQACKEKND